MILYQLRLDAIGARTGTEARAGHAVADVAVDRVEIVLADEQDRQLLERCEVHALVPRALVGRTFAEEAHDDRLRLLHLERQRRAHRIGDAGRHHRRRAHHADARVDEMHRARLAAGAAVDLAVELGHHAWNIAALGEIERVAAIGAEQDVRRLQVIADGRRHGFLADAEMDRALDLVRGIEADDLFFDPPDQVHRPIEAGRRVIRTLFHYAAAWTLLLQHHWYICPRPSARSVDARQPSAARRPLSRSRRGAPSGLLASNVSCPR